MFVERIKEEVYDTLVDERVCILVGGDVDALCASKILKWLFQQDNRQYVVIPIGGKEDLLRVYQEQCEEIKHFFLVNCGGGINLLEFLKAEEDVTLYIIDSHRPLDLDNVFSQDQIKILIKEGDAFDEIPDFDKLYDEEDIEVDSGESLPESSDDEDGSQPAKRRKSEREEEFMKKRRKQKWKKEREKILFDYYEYTCRGTAASLVLFELAWKMSKDNNTLLWWAILGLTEQYLSESIDREKYVSDASSLQNHVLRHNVNHADHVPSVDRMKISFENELRLVLYRHWSLYESLCHSQYTSCGFRLWTMKGKKRLHEFLADMGLPIKQSKQKFGSMDVELKTNAKSWIEESAQKFGLDDMVYGSFTAQSGYKTKVCAADVTMAVSAILESWESKEHQSDKFLEAMDVLSLKNSTLLNKGIDSAKEQLVAIVEQVRSLIDLHQIVCAGPFLYAHIREGTPSAKLFSKPSVLSSLARFTLSAYCVMARNKRAVTLPFVLSAPYNDEEATCLIIGIPPLAEDSPKNFFGAAFDQAASGAKSMSIHDFFDPTIIEIKCEDRSKFFDSLTALLLTE